MMGTRMERLWIPSTPPYTLSPPSDRRVPPPQEEFLYIHPHPLSPLPQLLGRKGAERRGQQLPGESLECWEPGNRPCSSWESQGMGILPIAPSPGWPTDARDPSSLTGGFV